MVQEELELRPSEVPNVLDEDIEMNDFTSNSPDDPPSWTWHHSTGFNVGINFSKDTGNSQANIGEVLPNTQRLIKRSRPKELFNDDGHLETGPRMQLRAGEAINVMAPSHFSDMAYDDEEIQIPPWAESSIPLTQVRPTFTVSQSDQFNFKLPSQLTTSLGGNNAIPIRHPSNGDCGMAYNNNDTPQPQLWSSQLRLLAAVATQPQNQNQNQELNDSDVTPGLPLPRPTGLCQIQSFRQVPLSLPRAHNIIMHDTNTKGGGNPERGAVHTFDIDEMSPDEDKRLAESIICNESGGSGGCQDKASLPVLTTNSANLGNSEEPITGAVAPSFRQPSGLAMTQGSAEDIVAQHHQCNHPSHLPNNEQLLAIWSQQTSHCVMHAHSATVDTDQHSHSVGCAHSTVDSTAETEPLISSHPQGPATLQPPASDTNSLPAIRSAMARWWPQYTNNISKLLWEDIGNWRSSLKKKARTFMCEHYQWDPQNCCSVNADLTKTLLERGVFLKHGQDEEGHTNNLAHPALAGLVVNFFYTGPSSVGILFPEVFGNEIKLVLDKVTAEGKEVIFKCNIYTNVYIGILGLMVKCDMTPIHQAKTKALRIQWAKIGRLGRYWDTPCKAIQLCTLLEEAGQVKQLANPGQGMTPVHSRDCDKELTAAMDEYSTGTFIALKFRHEDYSKGNQQFLEIIDNIDTMPHHLQSLWRALKNIAVQGC
ncbi:hypothetical protein OG21DRAFT_1527113 [Imleria badia]|nr:hypothetical protein OG21DRAFT_1527113 [Imleria badia]